MKPSPNGGLFFADCIAREEAFLTIKTPVKEQEEKK
jgi:hypothetical protein